MGCHWGSWVMGQVRWTCTLWPLPPSSAFTAASVVGHVICEHRRSAGHQLLAALSRACLVWGVANFPPTIKCLTNTLTLHTLLHGVWQHSAQNGLGK
jgi:hypothetical protein